MTFARHFYDWQKLGPPPKLPSGCSPALRSLLADVDHRWQMKSLGCRDPKATSDSGGPSTHRWAAIDLSYAVLGEKRAVDEVIPHLVAWSEEWGIQAIHHYRGSRIWRAGRTPNEADACSLWWKAQRPNSAGMGQSWASWLHVEVHPTRWNDARSGAARGIR